MCNHKFLFLDLDSDRSDGIYWFYNDMCFFYFYYFFFLCLSSHFGAVKMLRFS
jgi:hypothetical protein